MPGPLRAAPWSRRWAGLFRGRRRVPARVLDPLDLHQIPPPGRLWMSDLRIWRGQPRETIHHVPIAPPARIEESRGQIGPAGWNEVAESETVNGVFSLTLIKSSSFPHSVRRAPERHLLRFKPVIPQTAQAFLASSFLWQKAMTCCFGKPRVSTSHTQCSSEPVNGSRNSRPAFEPSPPGSRRAVL